MITFEVTSDLDSEEVWDDSDYTGTPKKFFEFIRGRQQERIEAAGGTAAFDFGHIQQGLVDATHSAFQSHLPLVLSPDDVWLTISQGVSRHVSKNADSLRRLFVMHEDKRELEVRRDSFVQGDPNNDWPGVWEELSQQIRENTVPKTYERLVSDFSTTGPMEKAISNLTLMDTMSGYFGYMVRTLCGIPKVTLLGTPDDWDRLYFKAVTLMEYDLGWWTDKLLPVLQQFALSAHGKYDKEWWQSFYKWFSMSGGGTIDGHIVNLFPYVMKSLGGGETSFERRTLWDKTASAHIPSGIVKVPFTWYYHGQTLRMNFKGGLVGVEKTEDGLRPARAWAVIGE